MQIKIIFLVVFLYLISVSLGSEKETCFITSETEEECGTVFYPIVKPLLRYFEICHGKHLKYLKLREKLSEVQEKYSKLQEKHSEVQDNNLEYQKKYSELMEKYLKLKETNSEHNSQKYSELLEKYSNLQEKSLKVQENYSKNLEQYSKRLEKYLKFPDTTSQVLENLNKNSELLEKYLKQQEKSLKVIGNYSEGQHKYPNPNSFENNAEKLAENRTSNADIFPDPCLEAKTNTAHEIELPGLLPFKVVCYSDRDEGPGWMKVVHKLADSNEFNRSYEEYKSGFGNLSGEFFIGLERLYLMTNQVPHESHVTIECEGGVESLYVIKCKNFVLGNEEEDYKLKILESCSGETWEWVPDTKFSTYDRDEDQNPDDNVASDFGCGWWHGADGEIEYGSCLIKMMIRRNMKNNES